MRRALLVLFLIPLLAFSQTTPGDNHWLPFQFFVGTWKGTGKGQPGISTLERKYEFVLSGKHLHVKHKSVYQPQEKNPKGEMHEDWGFYSYDRARKLLVFRQFHTEGFVIQYRGEPISQERKLLMFVSESIENIPLAG